MKTKIVICNSKEEMLNGLFNISEFYKNRPEKDGHKIFLVNRTTFYQLTNIKPEVTPPDEREVLFCSEDFFETLSASKKVDSQMSISRLTRSQNSEITCNSLIDWLLCSDCS